MSSEVADRYGRIADAFGARIQGCPPGAWSSPSPCPDWSAHDVVKHVVETHRMVLTRLTGGDPTPPDSGEDLAAAWQVESDAVRAALADPDRAPTEVESFGSTQPFESLVGTLLCADTLIHTWDLARATGQYDTLDPPSIDAARAFLEPNEGILRRPGGFGPKIEPPPDADAQTSFLCYVGRQP